MLVPDFDITQLIRKNTDLVYAISPQSPEAINVASGSMVARHYRVFSKDQAFDALLVINARAMQSRVGKGTKSDLILMTNDELKAGIALAEKHIEPIAHRLLPKSLEEATGEKRNKMLQKLSALAAPALGDCRVDFMKNPSVNNKILVASAHPVHQYGHITSMLTHDKHPLVFSSSDLHIDEKQRVFVERPEIINQARLTGAMQRHTYPKGTDNKNMDKCNRTLMSLSAQGHVPLSKHEQQLLSTLADVMGDYREVLSDEQLLKRLNQAIEQRTAYEPLPAFSTSNPTSPRDVLIDVVKNSGQESVLVHNEVPPSSTDVSPQNQPETVRRAR
jgi:predicted ATP-dependent protease